MEIVIAIAILMMLICIVLIWGQLDAMCEIVERQSELIQWLADRGMIEYNEDDAHKNN